MTAPKYSIKDLEKELFDNFPELKNVVTFLDPKDYENHIDVEEVLHPLFEADTDFLFENSNSPMKIAGNVKAVKDTITKQRLSMTMYMIKVGLPFAQNLRMDSNTDSLAGKDCIIFGGKEDLKAEDIMWRIMTAASGNMIANSDPAFADRLREEIENNYKLPPEFDNTEMLQTLFLDHEIAHAITMPMMKKSQMLDEDLKHHMECIADAYSMIRHYQRYGKDSKVGESLAAMRDMAAVMVPDTIHWTSEAIYKVIDLNKQGKIDNLTPKEAIDLAMQIAKEVKFDLDAANNVKKAFDTSPLRDAFAVSAMKTLNKTLENKSSDNDNRDFVDDVKNNMLKNLTHRIENKDKTIKKIGNIALRTKSSAVYRVTKYFLNSVDSLWKTIDKDALNKIKDAVNNRKDIPSSEPKRSLLQRGLHNLITRDIKRKFGK